MINSDIQPKRLFVSGMMRSGTTLIQKALSAHPEINVEYQSRTECLISIKNRFLESLGRADYHVLNHYNPSKGYRFPDFFEWQASQKKVGDEIFLESTVNNEQVVGVKEVLSEEFYPKLLDEGVYCLNIIRDPRDVISSMSFGNGREFTGKPRPILFDLRNWRKSVHFSLFLKDNSFFKTIFFEDLVHNPDSVFGELYDWLKVNKLPVTDIEKNMNEDRWAGNSSFGSKKPFDEFAIGRYGSSLPDSTISYIEAVCFPEMDWAGYRLDKPNLNFVDVIDDFRDPFPIRRSEFDKNYSFSSDNKKYEIGRVGVNIVDLNKELFND